MGAASRTKGQSGERELAALLASLTGHDVRRRVRNHRGDDDLVGLPGWGLECKRYRAAPPALVAQWWQQALAQALATECEPVLFYRADRGQWRAVWRAQLVLAQSVHHQPDLAAGATIEADPATWWALCSHTGRPGASADRGRGLPCLPPM